MRKSVILIFAAACASGPTVRTPAQLQAERERVACDNAFWEVLNASWEDLANTEKWKEQFERCHHQALFGLAVKGVLSNDPEIRRDAARVLLNKSFHMSEAAMLALETLNNPNALPQKKLEALRLFLVNDHAANRFLVRMLSDNARIQLLLQGKPVPLYPLP